jgi:hypothetical protein
MEEMMKKMGCGDYQGGEKGLSDQALLAELGGPSGGNHKVSDIDEMLKNFGLE